MTERVKVDRLLADRAEVRVDELGVAELVLGGVDGVDRELVLDRLQGFAVIGVARRKLGVLLPEVGLDQLRGGKEPQDRDVAAGRAPGRRELRRNYGRLRRGAPRWQRGEPGSGGTADGEEPAALDGAGGAKRRFRRAGPR